MADRIISAEVRISGQDAGAAEMLAKVAANIKKVDEVAAQSGQMQKLGRQMAELKTQMEAVGQLKTVQTNFGAMQTRAAEAAAKVEKLRTDMAAVAQPTEAMTRALSAAELASAKAAAAMVRQTEVLERNRKAVADMGLSTANAVREQERLARAFQDTARSAELTMRAEQRSERAANRLAHASHGAAGRHGGHGSGLDISGAIAGALAGHSVIVGAETIADVYREFDKERRYGKVVMGITDEQQKPLVEQAIHGGATSKFNDIQWLESQRELAMRGYNKDQVLGFTPIVAQIGQAFDVSMPEAVKALEGAMLGFGKDVSTFEKASVAATRTADLEVKASKISGMTFEDVVQLYKYGAAPAKMAHLSEESLLAYGAISKKSNMGGDESGVAFRNLAKNLISPTAEARTAMLANGIDFSKYQTAPKAIDMGAFVRDVAMKYGVELNDASKAGLARVFADPKMLGDPALFVPAVTQVLKETLGKQDAKSSKVIAGDARKFRDDSVGGIDTNGLMAAIMEGMSKSPQLANAIFGSKQGGRIYAALGDPKFFHHILDELQNESGGFAKKVSEDRMAGFDGAVSKFEGAVKNLESAFGRAFDNDGKGGFLTAATEGAAHFVQTLAEADPHLLQIGAAAAGLTGLWGSAKVVGLFSGGFGLKGSAFLLDRAAEHLMMVGGPGGVPKVPPGAILPSSGVAPALAVPAAVELGAGLAGIGGAALGAYVVKKAFEAQQPGQSGLWAPATLATEKEDRQDVAALQAERAEVAKRIADQKAREKIPGTADTATTADRARLEQLDNAIDNKVRSLDALHPNVLPPTAPLPIIPDHTISGLPGPARVVAFPTVVAPLPEARPPVAPRPAPPPEPTDPPYRDRKAERGRAMTELELRSTFHPADDDRQTRARASDAASWLDELGRKERESIWQFGQLNDRTGVVLTAFDGLQKGGGALVGDFTLLGTGSGSAAQQLDILALAARTVAGAFANLLAAGPGGGGSGVIAARYEDGGTGGGFGSGGGGFGGRGDSGGGTGYRGGGKGGDFTGGGDGAFKGGAAPGKQSLLAKEAYDFWRSKGLDHAHAIGMVVQEQAENNFGNTPGDVVHGRPTAFSPFQFHLDRARLIKRGTGIDVTDPNLSHADALRAAYYDATKGGRAGFLDRYSHQASGLDGASDYATQFYEGPKNLRHDQAIRRGYAHGWDRRGFPGSVAAAAAAAALPALPKGGYWAKDSKGNLVAVGPDGAAIPGLSPRPKPVDEHPALAAPALPRKASHPADDAPTTTAHHELLGAVRRMTAAVERGSLHRVEIKPHRTLLAQKTYSRGSHGTTIA